MLCELVDDWEDWVEDDDWVLCDDDEEELCGLVLWLVDVDDELVDVGVEEDWAEDDGVELCELDCVDICCSIWFGEEYSTLKAFPLNTIVWTEDGENPIPEVPKLGTSISTSALPDCHDTRDEISTYWYWDNVYVCDSPVAGLITVKVVVLGDKFNKYTSDGGVELDGVDDEELDDVWEELLFCELILWLDDIDDELCELDDDDEVLLDDWEEFCELDVEEDDEELLLCELDVDEEELDDEPDDDICCSICSGDENSTLKAFPSYTTVSTEVG